MSIDITASKIKTFPSDSTQSSTRGYGQNGSAVSPSQKPGEVRAISKGMADVSPPPVSANPGNWQTRDAGPNKLAATPGNHNPNADPTTIGVNKRPSFVKAGTAARTNAMPEKGVSLPSTLVGK